MVKLEEEEEEEEEEEQEEEGFLNMIATVVTLYKGWPPKYYRSGYKTQKATILPTVGFEVLTAVVMKSTIFRDIAPCSPLSVNRRFGGTYRLLLQGRRMRLLATCSHSGFLLCLFFDLEDGGNMFLRNVG
jgi:hypothetical protein